MSDSALLHKEWHAWVGQKVCVSKRDLGTLKYFGEIRGKSGFWCGVELDKPIGMTDGVINNKRYFKCKVTHGVFVPMHDVKRVRRRGIDISSLADFSELRPDVPKRSHSKNSRRSLDATFEVPKRHSPIISSTPLVQRRHSDKHVNVRKRSKQSSSSNRVGTEESLGILSNLLDDDGSWDLLELPNGLAEEQLTCKLAEVDEEDSVFSPEIKLPSAIKSHPQQGFTKPLGHFGAKCTSTPKHFLGNVYKVGEVINIDQFNFDLSFDHVETEPIIAGSSGTKSMDLDSTRFDHNELLCSTTKLISPELQNEFMLGDATFIGDIIQHKSSLVPPSANLTNYHLPSAAKVPEGIDVLNKTYEINPEENLVKQLHQNLDFQTNALDKNADEIINLNSTFVLPISPEEAVADKTFVLDDVSADTKQHAVLEESELDFRKKSLSVILEKTSNENLSNIDDLEGFDQPNSSELCLKANGNQAPTSNELSDSKASRVISLKSHEEQATDLNSTFSVSTPDDLVKKRNAFKNVSKRYSLSSISMKNELPVKQNKSAKISISSAKQPPIINNKKTALKAPGSYGLATSKAATKDLEGSFNTLPNKAADVNIKVASKNPYFKSSQSASKDNSKVKDSMSMANVAEKFKKTINSCKSLYKQTRQLPNAPQITVKVTEKNTQVTSRRQSVGGMVTRVTSKVSYTSNKISTSENVNGNSKVNRDLTSNCISETKSSVIKRRHTMLPSVPASGTYPRKSLIKTKSEMPKSSSENAKPMFGDKKHIEPSMMHQDVYGDKKENRRSSILKKPAPVGRVMKDIGATLDNKQIDTVASPKKQLLKPGMLSRLPVRGSLRKPGFTTNATEPLQSTKSNTQDDKQRMYQRLPLRKMQEQFP